MELALTRGTISSSYLDVMCNGVAQRDVEALLLPEPPFEKPGEDGTRKRRHDALMRRADAAADAGDARESCALAEEAYGVFRSFRALVLFADARSACGEPHLAAALLHSALRVLALSPSEHAHAQELLADVEQQLLSRSSGGAARRGLRDEPFDPPERRASRSPYSGDRDRDDGRRWPSNGGNGSYHAYSSYGSSEGGRRAGRPPSIEVPHTPLDGSRASSRNSHHSSPHSRPLGFSRCLLYTSPSPRDGLLSRMPSSA